MLRLPFNDSMFKRRLTRCGVGGTQQFLWREKGGPRPLAEDLLHNFAYIIYIYDYKYIHEYYYYYILFLY